MERPALLDHPGLGDGLGSEADFVEIEAALPDGPARFAFAKIHQRVQGLKGFWAAPVAIPGVKAGFQPLKTLVRTPSWPWGSS